MEHATIATKDRTDRAGFIFLILIAFALRVYRLSAQSLWYDEGVSLLLASKRVPDLVAHTARDIHPPLYYLLLHGWTDLAGRSEFAAAYFSLFFGVLLVALVFRLAQVLYGTRAALLAALLVALSPYNLWYAQEVRMYTLGATLGLLATWLLLRMLRDDCPAWVWPVYTITAATGLYTLYYFAFLLVFHNLFFLIAAATRPELRARLRRWLLTDAGITLLYAPWIPVLLRQALHPPVPPWRTAVPLPRMLAEAWTVLSVGQSVTATGVWPALLATLILFALALRVPTRTNDPLQRWLLVGHVWVPAGLIFLASFGTPLYHARYLFTYAAPFYILLGAALAFVLNSRRRQQVLAVSTLLVLLLAYGLGNFQFFFDPTYASDDYRAALQFIDEQWRPGDAILVNAGYVYPMVLYYGHRAPAWRGRLTNLPEGCGTANAPLVAQTGTIDGDPALGWGDPASDFYATTAAETDRSLQQLFRQCQRVWVLRAYDTVTDPHGFIRRWLDEHETLFEDQVVSGQTNVRVQGYRSRNGPREDVRPLDRSFDHRLRLTGSLAFPQPAVAGRALYVTLYWQPLVPLPADYRLSLALLGPGGRQWAVADELPGGALFPPSKWPVGERVRHTLRLDIPTGTPPGTYRLAAGVYDPSDGHFLRPDDSQSAAGTIRVALGVVNVQPAVEKAFIIPSRLQAIHAVLGEDIELTAYQAMPHTLRPGDVLSVEILWHALRPPPEDDTVFVQLVDGNGKLWAARDSRPVEGRYPTTAWPAGGWVRDFYDLPLAANAPAGTYRLIAGLYRTAGGTRLPVRQGWLRWLGRGDYAEMGVVPVHDRAHSFAPPPAMAHPADVTFGTSAQLVGYALPAAEAVHAGAPLTVTLYWKALASSPISYKVFAHLVAADGTLWGQRDQFPGDGQFPTTGWQSGEYLTDTLAIPVPENVPAGRYRLRVGLYDPATGTRLPVRGPGVPDGADYATLALE